MARIHRSARSHIDYLDIWLRIASDNFAAADQLIDRFDQQLETLAQNPLIGRSRDELRPGLRSWPVGNYLLIYRPRGRH